MSNSWLPINQIATKVRRGDLKAADLVEQSLKAIEDKKDYQTVISVVKERARSRAKDIDELAKKGQNPGKLAGVPFIAKDNFLVFGAETTAASNMLKGFVAPYQASVINQLEAEGAICVAKANLDAYGHGSSTENSDYFVTKNPYDKTRVPGGSSGGSAAAVALDLAPFAIGTDTGSSIRLPASYCNVVGFKPSYGAVSRSGVVAMASSLDTIGPMTKNVADTATVFDVMADKDELDSTTTERDPKGYELTEGTNLKGKKFGLIKEYMDDSVDSEVKQAILKAVEKIKTNGASVNEISLKSMPLSLAVYYILCPAEVSSNLARYDGQRYPYSYGGAKDLEDSYLQSRSRGFGREAKRRIMMGTYVLSSGYYDAYYKRAQIVRRKLINELSEAFKDYDFLLGPVSPSLPFKIGERTKDPLKMYLSDLLVVSANLAGLPAISLPAGLVNGLPVGLQVIAPAKEDRQLLLISKAIEEILS